MTIIHQINRILKWLIISKRNVINKEDKVVLKELIIEKIIRII